VFFCVTCTYLGDAGNLKYLPNERPGILNYINNEMQQTELLAKGKQKIRYTNPREASNLNYLIKGTQAI
jgi:hypothetical protein